MPCGPIQTIPKRSPTSTRERGLRSRRRIRAVRRRRRSPTDWGPRAASTIGVRLLLLRTPQKFGSTWPVGCGSHLGKKRRFEATHRFPRCNPSLAGDSMTPYLRHFTTSLMLIGAVHRAPLSAEQPAQQVRIVLPYRPAAHGTSPRDCYATRWVRPKQQRLSHNSPARTESSPTGGREVGGRLLYDPDGQPPGPTGSTRPSLQVAVTRRLRARHPDDDRAAGDRDPADRRTRRCATDRRAKEQPGKMVSVRPAMGRATTSRDCSLDDGVKLTHVPYKGDASSPT